MNGVRKVLNNRLEAKSHTRISGYLTDRYSERKEEADKLEKRVQLKSAV